MPGRSVTDDITVVLREALSDLYAAESEALDARDGFPERAVAKLNSMGLQRHYIPARDGGELVEYDLAGRLIRRVAAVDLTVAVAHGKTYLGGVSVWIAGSEDQRMALARIIADGSAVSWALTERDHGSDLLAGEVVAESAVVGSRRGYRLTGEKWLINNATRGVALCVLARTSPAAGPRGYSLFLVDKTDLDPGSFGPLPKELTHGIRGADISGIRFDDAFVAEDTVVGDVGQGIEIVLSAMQLTRTMCCYLSLGASDHALAIAGGFVLGRELYGRPLLELPAAREAVADAVSMHALAEAFTTFAARSAHALPQEHSLIAAAAKYLVPTMIEDSLTILRRLTGARALIIGSTDNGTLAKVERDHRIVSLFDGNTMVNLTTLVTQFPILFGRVADSRPDEIRSLHTVTDLSAALPPFDPEKLSLVSKRGLTVLRYLGGGAASAELTVGLSEAVAHEVHRAVTVLAAEVEKLASETALIPRQPVETSVEAFDAAERLAVCIAGAAATALWAHSRDLPTTRDNALWADGLWLRLALSAALDRLGCGKERADAAVDAISSVFVDAVAFGRPISIFSDDSATSEKLSDEEAS
jgi:alkylation response protein AidB-like acyl-CoA dehydrogenase